MEKKQNGEQQGIQFPCDFSIKVIGKNSPEFDDLVLDIVRQHFPEFKTEQLQKKFSQLTTYTSLTITVYAENREQLDNLYKQLTTTPGILIVL